MTCIIICIKEGRSDLVGQGVGSFIVSFVGNRKAEIACGSASRNLYLEFCWELSEVSLLFSIPFMVYSKLRASLRTFWAVGIKYY